MNYGGLQMNNVVKVFTILIMIVFLNACTEDNAPLLTIISMNQQYAVYEQGSIQIDLPEMHSEVYEFSGWYLDDAFQDKYTHGTLTEDTTIYAKWIDVTHTVYFMLDQDTVYSSVEVVHGDTVDELEISNTDFTVFSYWALYPSQEEGAFQFDTAVTEDIYLYAIFRNRFYKVTFVDYDRTFEYSVSYNYPNIIYSQNRTRNHYLFEGWYLDEELTTSFDLDILTEDITVYAKYSPKPYTVLFRDFNTIMINTYYYGDIAEPIPSSSIYEPHTFLGWFENEYADTPFDFASTADGISVTLYARYSVPVEIHSYGNVITLNHIAGRSIELPDLEDMEYEAFAGWYRDSSFLNPYQGEPIIHETHLYAKWEPTHYEVTVAYKTSQMMYKYYYFAIDDVIEGLPDLVITGYTFGGYYTDLFYSTPYQFGTTLTQDIQVYAKLTQNIYTIYFDTNGGVESFQPVSATFKQPMILQTPTRPGYLFDVWLGLDGRVYRAGEVIQFSELNDVYLTAYWIEIS